MTPTARTLKHLRALGHHAEVVERWVPFARRRRDFAGFADILAFHQNQAGVLGVQVTTASNMAARISKLTAVAAVQTWLAAGNRVEVHGWSKKGAKGKRKCWTLTTRVIAIGDLDSAIP